MDNEEWQIAQKGEREWWGGCSNTYFEEEKQLVYAEKMGLQKSAIPETPYSFDMAGKSVLDIGGGPASLLLKCRNVKGVVADPLDFPSWVMDRYKDAGIEYKRCKGEDIDSSMGMFDEVWIYNVLLHVDDPRLVIEKAKALGKVMRIFEWVNTVKNEMHPHVLSKEQLDQWLDTDGQIEDIRQGRSITKSYSAVVKAPVTIHFILSDGDLIYPYYLAIMSAHRTQKNCRICLWSYKVPESPYWPFIKNTVDLKIISLQGLPDSEDRQLRAEIAKNLFEFSILYNEGGIFLDLDTFCISDITDHLVNSKTGLVLVNEVENHAPSYPFFNVAAVMSEPKNAIIKEVLDKIIAILEKPPLEKGETGRILATVGREHIGEFDALEYGSVGGGGVDRLIDKLADENAQLWDNAKVLHLFGSNYKDFDMIDADYIKNSQTLFARTVREVLSKADWNIKAPKVDIKPESIRVARHKRFHLLGLPHVATNKQEALACAFSQKVIKMAKMLKSLGHPVFFYGVEGSTVECDEFIQVSTQDILKQAYGEYDMREITYKHAQGDIAYETFNDNVITEIQKRMQPDDFLLIPFSPQRYKKIIDTLDTSYINSKDKLHLIVEMGIGYRGTYCRYKVFESVSQMHYNYGLESAKDMGATRNGNWYDAVIPNYFDPEDFEYSDQKKDYFLYLGRVIHRKGISVAIKTCETIGAKLVIAGQDGEEGVNLNSPNVEYVGFADVEKRKALLRDAKALFLPTFYIEPFGGVIIEAAFSGTPVITSDWGAFPELVIHGKTGYRCHTLDHFVWAANNIDKLHPSDCYIYAMRNFSLERVRWMYEEYFNMLLDVKENKDGQGWNRLHPERTELDWLKRVV